MNFHPVTPSAGSGHAGEARRRRSVSAGMSDGQMRAYLVARDAVRRVQRSAPLFDTIAPTHRAGLH